MARPKANAIGTAANTIAPTKNTKKMSRLRLPSGFSTGASNAKTAMMTATRISAASTLRKSDTLASRSKATTSIKPMPTGCAAARQALTISSAGRRCDVNLVGGELVRGVDYEKQERKRGRNSDYVQERPSVWTQLAHYGRHPHVLVTLEGEHGA